MMIYLVENAGCPEGDADIHPALALLQSWGILRTVFRHRRKSE
jgi:hypothetical protein